MYYLDGIIFSLQKSGGISVYFAEIINRIINSGDEFQCEIHQSNDVINDYEIKLEVSKSKFPIFISRYFDVDIPRTVSVFHSTYYRIPSRKKRKNCKVITTVHDFTYEMFGKGLSKFIHSQQKRRAILNSDVIICISESTKNDMLKFIPKSKDKDIIVVPNGVSDDFYISDDISGNNKRTVVFVGSRAGYKNFISLVRALDKTNYFLDIVGGGELSKKERDFLEEKIPGRYHKFGFVSNLELNKIYNRAFCLVYPSLYEGFGIPPLEAMKAGCPVIASNTSSLPEVCGDAAILIDNIDSDKINSALDKLKDDNIRSEFVKKGLIQSKKYSWQLTYEKIISIYNG